MQPTTSQQRIPRTIFQTNKTATVSKKTLDNVRHFLSINPEWEYKFYDDQRCDAFFAVSRTSNAQKRS